MKNGDFPIEAFWPTSFALGRALLSTQELAENAGGARFFYRPKGERVCREGAQSTACTPAPAHVAQTPAASSGASPTAQLLPVPERANIFDQRGSVSLEHFFGGQLRQLSDS